jgi:hypothetical protein
MMNSEEQSPDQVHELHPVYVEESCLDIMAAIAATKQSVRRSGIQCSLPKQVAKVLLLVDKNAPPQEVNNLPPICKYFYHDPMSIMIKTFMISEGRHLVLHSAGIPHRKGSRKTPRRTQPDGERCRRRKLECGGIRSEGQRMQCFLHTLGAHSLTHTHTQSSKWLFRYEEIAFKDFQPTSSKADPMNYDRLQDWPVGMLCSAVAEVMCLLFGNDAVEAHTGRVREYVFSPTEEDNSQIKAIYYDKLQLTAGLFTPIRDSCLKIAVYIQSATVSMCTALTDPLTGIALKGKGKSSGPLYVGAISLKEEVSPMDLKDLNISLKGRIISLSDFIYGMCKMSDLDEEPTAEPETKDLARATYVAGRLKVRVAIAVKIMEQLGTTLNRTAGRGARVKKLCPCPVKTNCIDAFFAPPTTASFHSEEATTKMTKPVLARQLALQVSEVRRLEMENAALRLREEGLKAELVKAHVVEEGCLGRMQKQTEQHLMDLNASEPSVSLRRHTSDVWAVPENFEHLEDMNRRARRVRQKLSTQTSVSQSSGASSLPHALERREWQPESVL